jgi:glutamate/aspartate transport system substrate-binding protein
MRFAAALVALCLLPGLAPAQSSAALDGRLKKIRDAQTINVAWRTDSAPFSYEDPAKQPTGYTIELCKRVVGAIEKQLGLSGLKTNWVPVTVDTRFEGLVKGEVDMECGSTTVTLGRMKTVDFSSFIFIDGTGLLVRSAFTGTGLSDLGGKKIGVIAGTSNERALNEALKARVLTAAIVNVKTRDEGLEQVESGAIDAYASDRVLLIGLAAKSKDPKSLALLADALSFEPYAITLPRGDWQFRLAVNTALAQIYRSGAIGEVYGRWFGAFGKPGALVEATVLFGAIPE